MKIGYLILIVLMSQLCAAETKEKEVTKKDLDVAEKALKNLGIDKNKVEMSLEGMAWQQECGVGELTGDNPLRLTFVVSTTAPLKAKGLELEARTSIEICDGEIIELHMPHEEKKYSVEGYSCVQKIAFLVSGELCECKLAQAAKVNKFFVPKGATIYLSKRKKPRFFLPLEDKKLGLSPGFYEIRESKARKTDLEYYRCEYDE